MKELLVSALLRQNAACRHRWKDGICRKCGDACTHQEVYDTSGSGFVWEIPEWSIVCKACHAYLGHSHDPQARERWLRST